MPKQRPAQRLYLFVLASVLVGGAVGVWKPNLGIQLKPLGDAFISLVKMLIGPVIFCTVVLGISGAGDMRKVGRVGMKALIYFEVVSTLALFLGLLVMNFARPGAGFNVDPSSLDASLVSGFAKTAGEQDFVKFLLRIIPKTFTDAFGGSGDLLQVLLVALLFGYALSRLGKAGETVRHLIEEVSHIFFAMMNVVMKLAPFGACGAMAFTMGKYGWKALKPLASLMGFFYLTCAVFILCVLGPLARYAGFSILRFIAYIRDELLTVLGTSSSESALVDLMRKLERLGCSKSVTGLVVPAGFSFNLDGTNIYLTMASLFLAQALNIELSLKEQLTLLGVAMLTSKGASGVTGAGFITLAATLEVVPSIPVWSMALLVGIDRFMSEARALTNFIGNGVATLVIAHHEKELDHVRLEAELGKIPPTGG